MKRALFLACLSLIGACGGGSRDVPTTLGEVCLDLSEVTCGRLKECDSTLDRNRCETQLYAACCADDGNCDSMLNAAAAPTEEEYNACLDDIGDQACAQIQNGDLPASCDML